MDKSQKLFTRAAAQIHQVLGQRLRHADRSLPTDAWEELQALARKVGIASQHGWDRAAASLVQEMAWAADSCQSRLAALGRELRTDSTRKPPVTEGEIYRDLLALEEEFEQVSCDFDEQEVRATTEPIELEGFYLGRFEIRLQWERIHQSTAYRVVALNPNPSNSREEVTHPHVADEHLCEGEGRLAIRSALDQGRIGDFFLIVLNLLRTYSRGRAYVELDDWDGVSCSNCDASCSSDGLYSCRSCCESLCGECTVSCDSCGDAYCSGCISGCTQCDVDFCSNCLRKCRECKTSVCSDCLKEGDLCQSCFDKQHPAESHDEVISEPAVHQPQGIAAIAIQSNRLGQATVSPRPRDERGRWVRRNAA
jgi:hypothetical protein